MQRSLGCIWQDFEASSYPCRLQGPAQSCKAGESAANTKCQTPSSILHFYSSGFGFTSNCKEQGKCWSPVGEVKGFLTSSWLRSEALFPGLCVLGPMTWVQPQSNFQTAEMQGKFGLQHQRGCQLKMYNAKLTHSSKARATTSETATPQLTDKFLGLGQVMKTAKRRKKLYEALMQL